MNQEKFISVQEQNKPLSLSQQAVKFLEKGVDSLSKHVAKLSSNKKVAVAMALDGFSLDSVRMYPSFDQQTAQVLEVAAFGLAVYFAVFADRLEERASKLEKKTKKESPHNPSEKT